MKRRFVPLFLVLSSASFLEAKDLFSFAPLIGQITPGVVNIQSSETLRREAGLDLYEHYLGGRPPAPGQARSLGTGFVWDRQGYIVTSYRVIKDVSNIEVLVNARSKNLAKIVGVDAKTDLALLKIAPRDKLHPLSLGDDQTLRLGDVVLAVTNPFGFSHYVSSGIIAGLGKLTGQESIHLLDTDIAIHPGKQGSPLLDTRGRVIGMASLREEAMYRNRNVVVPINTVKKVVAEIKRFGKVKRAWLGIVIQNILSHDELAYAKDPAGVHGVLLSNLIVGGPAHKAALQIGDVILSMDGQKLFDTNHFETALLGKEIGTKVKLKLYRREKGYLEAEVTLEELPENQELPTDGLF
ncbi:MAG: trypsin-like peptidase domain-containing protein [Deltaproteobacteria bacterium]|nr:trypsin-like peptidase domain-containing protein [Deltaproteobacteria bacterium]